MTSSKIWGNSDTPWPAVTTHVGLSWGPGGFRSRWQFSSLYLFDMYRCVGPACALRSTSMVLCVAYNRLCFMASPREERSCCAWSWGRRFPNLLQSARVSQLCYSPAPQSTGEVDGRPASLAACGGGGSWSWHGSDAQGSCRQRGPEEKARRAGLMHCATASMGMFIYVQAVSSIWPTELRRCRAVHCLLDKPGTTVLPGVNHHRSAEINTVLVNLVILLEV